VRLCVCVCVCVGVCVWVCVCVCVTHIYYVETIRKMQQSNDSHRKVDGGTTENCWTENSEVLEGRRIRQIKFDIRQRLEQFRVKDRQISSKQEKRTRANPSLSSTQASRNAK